MTVNLLEWPGIWYGIFFKPDKTAERLKNEKLCFNEGIISMLLASVLLGLMAFIVLAVIWSMFGAVLSKLGVGGGLGIFGAGIAVLFLCCIILFPIFCVVMLLIATILLKISSMLLKGKGEISAECGYLGAVGSAGLIAGSIFYLLLIVLMVLAFAVGGVSMMTGGGGFALGGSYILMGIVVVPISVLMYVYMAFFLDMLAYIEEVSIYRSGAIIGLCYGILMMIILVISGLFMMAAFTQFQGYQNTRVYPNSFRYT